MCPARSMKAIESCLDNLPILCHLSGQPLPKKDLPFSYVKSKSNMTAHISNEDQLKHQKQPNNWWLSDMDVQILCAFLLWNQSSNQFVHVICPTKTKMMQEVYDKKIRPNRKSNQCPKTLLSQAATRFLQICQYLPRLLWQEIPCLYLQFGPTLDGYHCC